MRKGIVLLGAASLISMGLSSSATAAEIIYPVDPPAPTTISAGDADTVYIDGAGQVRGYGSNLDGELGGEGPASSARVIPGLPEGVKAVALSMHGTSLAVVGSNGKVYGSGSNQNHQLTGASIADVAVLTPFAGLPEDVSVRSVAVGSTHSLVIAKDGRVFGTGSNADGELGGGGDRVGLEPVPGLPEGISAIAGAVGDHHSVVIGNDGMVYGIGLNDKGQLSGDDAGHDSLTAFSGLESGFRARAVVAGTDHTSILDGRGAMWSVGDNDAGEFGVGEPAGDGIVRTPVKAIATTGFASIATYGSTTIARSSGYIYGVGANAGGARIPGSTVGTTTFAAFKDADGATSASVAEIALGAEHTALLDYQGFLLGTSPDGRGFGDSTPRPFPVNIAGQPLVASGPPRIVGDVVVGEILSPRDAGWSPSTGTSEFQWLRDGVEVASDPYGYYAVSSDDIGSRLSLRETRSSPGMESSTLVSEAVEVLQDFVLTKVATLKGIARVGETLGMDAPGVWDPEPAQRTYRWVTMPGGGIIEGADGTTIRIAPGFVNQSVYLEETVSRPGYRTNTSLTRSTKIVQGLIKIVPPKISGAVKLGSTLTGAPGAVTPSDATVTYQWVRDNAFIAGQTAAKHIVVKDDIGRTLRLRQEAVRFAYDFNVALSPVIRVPALNTARPKVSGTFKVGKKLTAAKGSWLAPGHTFSYQWLRSGKAISKATKSTYRLTKSDRKKTVTVRVTAKKSGFTSVSAWSYGKKVK